MVCAVHSMYAGVCRNICTLCFIVYAWGCLLVHVFSPCVCIALIRLLNQRSGLVGGDRQQMKDVSCMECV